MNMSLIILEVNYGAINDDDSPCHGYHMIKFSSYPYTLQADLIIDSRVISSDEMVCEGTCFQSISILVIMFYKNKFNNTIIYLMIIIYGDVNVICYDLKDFVPSCLRYIPRNDYSTLSPLHIPME